MKKNNTNTLDDNFFELLNKYMNNNNEKDKIENTIINNLETNFSKLSKEDKSQLYNQFEINLSYFNIRNIYEIDKNFLLFQIQLDNFDTSNLNISKNNKIFFEIISNDPEFQFVILVSFDTNNGNLQIENTRIGNIEIENFLKHSDKFKILFEKHLILLEDFLNNLPRNDFNQYLIKTNIVEKIKKSKTRMKNVFVKEKILEKGFNNFSENKAEEIISKVPILKKYKKVIKEIYLVLIEKFLNTNRYDNDKLQHFKEMSIYITMFLVITYKIDKQTYKSLLNKILNENDIYGIFLDYNSLKDKIKDNFIKENVYDKLNNLQNKIYIEEFEDILNFVFSGEIDKYKQKISYKISQI